VRGQHRLRHPIARRERGQRREIAFCLDALGGTVLVSELLTHRVREKLKGSLAAGSRDGNGTRKRRIPDEALDRCLPTQTAAA
jgi:hypothetical protein